VYELLRRLWVPGRKRLLALAAGAAGLDAAGAAAGADDDRVLEPGSLGVAYLGDAGRRGPEGAAHLGRVRRREPGALAGRRSVVFVRRRLDRRDELYRVDTAGGGLRRLTRTSAAEANPAWAPRGGLIAFEYGRPVSSLEIGVVPANGTGRRRLTSNGVADVEPAWAPAAPASRSPATSGARTPTSSSWA
jgi:hypothetical protein